MRTVYRDVEELSASGIPVYADRGTHGGFQLVEGYGTRFTGLTPEEAEALFLSGYPGPAAQLGLGTVLAAAQLKVLAALPPELRSRRRAAPALPSRRSRLVRAAGHSSSSAGDRRGGLVRITGQLRMHYRRGSEDGTVVERVVDPLGLVLKAGIWYLVARSDGGLRTYRVLEKIADLTPLPDRFERPDDFDLAEYWGRSVAAYAASLPSFIATVRVRGDGLERLVDAIGEQANAAIGAAGEPDEGGWLTVSLKLEDVWHAEPQMLQLGADAEVVGPDELRERLAAVARTMTALYQ